MHLKRLLGLSIILCTTVFMAACGGFFTDPVLKSISITPPSSVIGQGGTVQLTANGVNDDGSTRTLNDVTWTSSDESIATVSGTGLVTAVKAGNATITANSGSITGTTTINVTTADLVSITVTPPTAVVAPGQQRQFTATAQLANGQTTDVTQLVTWSSSDTTVATINNQGVATAQTNVGASQTATITATSGTIKGTAQLTVGI